MIRIYDSGPSSLIASLCYDLEIPQLLDKTMQWTDGCKLSPGTRILALIINILTSRSPLYEVNEFYEDQDLECLFLCPADIDDLYDKALYNALIAFFHASPQDLLNRIANTILLKEDVKPKVVHGNTISWSVHDQYDQEDNYEGNSKKTIAVEPDHWKDHRSDLKQFKYSLVVTEDTFPIIAHLLPEGLSDKKWADSLVDIVGVFLKQIGTNEIVFVANSSLVTKDNLEKIKEKEEQGIALQFISRLPDSFSLGKKLKELAWAKNQWTTLGAISDEKDTSTYKYQEFEDLIEGNTYKFLVVHSTKLNAKKRKHFHKKLAKDIESLDKAIKKIGQVEHDSEEEAKETYETFYNKYSSRFYKLEPNITSIQKRLQQTAKGRHPSNYIPDYEDKYKLSVTRSDIDETAIQQEEKRLGCFILLSNATCELSSEDMLVAHKKGSAPKTGFKFIKNPTVVDPIFLKTVEGLESLAYVVMIASLVYTVLERRVRNNLKKEAEPIIITGGKKTYNPTGFKILESLRRMKVIKGKMEEEAYRYIPEDNYKEDHLLNMERVLRLSGYDMSIYIKPKK